MSINIAARTDYSALFSSMNSGSSNSSSSFYNSLADYASIKNGSYGKVVSAYYKKVANKNTSSTSSAEETDSTSSASTSTSTATATAKIAKQAQSLENDIADLQTDSLYDKKSITTKDESGNSTTSYDYDRSSILSAAKSFVKDYNNLLSDATDSTSSNVSTRASYMNNLTKSYSGKLQNIGISVDSSTGKLSLDEDTFNNSNVSDIQNLLGSKTGFAYSVSSAASLIESAASTAVSSSTSTGYTSSGTYNNSYSSMISAYI